MARKVVEIREGMATPQTPEASAKRKSTSPPRWAAMIAGTLAFATLAGGSVYGYQRLEQFLIRDARFAVALPDGDPDDVLKITGVKHASIDSIESAFARDMGRSLYLVPIERRLQQVRKVAWVRDASIARLWPNRLEVRVQERVPMAFVTLSPSEIALMDLEGEILPPTQAKFDLPVVTGLANATPKDVRQRAMQRVEHLATEIGAEIKEISEIDVSRPENLVVYRAHGDRVITLLLGNRNYGTRYRNYLRHRNDVDQNASDAKVLDLRVEDRITIREEE
jgi:cell division protein FtsQ